MGVTDEQKRQELLAAGWYRGSCNLWWVHDSFGWVATLGEAYDVYRNTLRGDGHMSDCATHNGPAYPAGECNCKTR